MALTPAVFQFRDISQGRRWKVIGIDICRTLYTRHMPRIYKKGGEANEDHGVSGREGS
jgi:hypothetical protein